MNAICIKNLDHVVLRTRDVPKMIAFYRDVLGCSVERTLEAFGLVQLRAGASLIDLVDTAGPIGQAKGAPPGDGGANMDHFCLRLEAFDESAIRAQLATHGLKAGRVEDRYGADGTGCSIYIRDPEGNTVELKGPPKTGPLA
jgi:catechol 2,3-dioxygenase-like lactoylglutathione lyase family enzyme